MTDNDDDDDVEYYYDEELTMSIKDDEREPEFVGFLDVCTCHDDILSLAYGTNMLDKCMAKCGSEQLILNYHYDTKDYHFEAPRILSPKGVICDVSRLVKLPEIIVEGKHVTIKNWFQETSIGLTFKYEQWEDRARRKW